MKKQKYDSFKMDDYNSPDEAIEQDELEDSNEEFTESDDEILKKFKDDQASADAHWNDIYSDMEEDWDIYQLNQWTDSAKRVRGTRPKVTVDITRKFVKSVVAETFRNPPGVKLSARKQTASAKAQAIADAIRYFEDRTGAIYAYSFAKESAAVAGLGWLKVTYRYDEQQAMPAVIDIDRVDDPLSIKIDPDSRELDGSDMLFAIEEHGKKDRKTKFTYWWKDDEGTVKWALICDGKEIEDKGTWPGNDIPIVPVYGECYRIRNQVTMFGLIRQLKDTQRTYNYVLSEGVERLALTPKSPITAFNGSISDQHLPDWQRSMIEPVPVLFANAYDANGNPLAMPTRGNSEPDTAWLSPLIQQLQQNAKETTGIYDTALGANSQEQSGIAIKARIESGDRGHLVFDEHLQISIKQVGRIMLDLLEPVVTPAGVLPILGEDGSTGIVPVGVGDPMQPDQFVLPDLDPSDLDISVSAAPAYATRKQEGLDNVIKLMPSLPPEQQALLIPKIINDMDFPGASEFSNILQPQQTGGVDPMAMQQLQDQLNAVTQQLTQAQQDNMMLSMRLNENTEAMLAKAQMDNNTKMAIAQLNAQVKMSSDDKGLTKTQIQETEENRRTMAKLAQDAEQANAEVAVQATEMKMDLAQGIAQNVM